MKNYFEGVTTLDELKAVYRKLAMLHHPDRGGDPETMKAINAQHDELFETLKTAHNANADEYHQTTETASEFRTVVLELLKLEGLKIELCGSWLWITGDTYAHKDALKAIGCKWSKNKMSWYWHHPEAGQRYHRGKATMADIRTKYGSMIFTAPGAADMAAAV